MGKSYKDTINQVLANSGTPFAAQAQEELRKSEAKKAAASVVKHAVVGGIVAGPAGAVVGAIAGKAKNDKSQTNLSMRMGGRIYPASFSNVQKGIP